MTYEACRVSNVMQIFRSKGTPINLPFKVYVSSTAFSLILLTEHLKTLAPL